MLKSRTVQLAVLSLSPSTFRVRRGHIVPPSPARWSRRTAGDRWRAPRSCWVSRPCARPPTSPAVSGSLMSPQASGPLWCARSDFSPIRWSFVASRLMLEQALSNHGCRYFRMACRFPSRVAQSSGCSIWSSWKCSRVRRARRLFGRVAAIYNQRDGFIENAAGGTLNGKNTAPFHASLRWLPSLTSTVDLIANFQHHDSAGTSA